MQISSVKNVLLRRILVILLLPLAVLGLVLCGVYDGILTAYYSSKDLLSGIVSDAKETWKA